MNIEPEQVQAFGFVMLVYGILPAAVLVGLLAYLFFPAAVASHPTAAAVAILALLVAVAVTCFFRAKTVARLVVRV